MRDYSEMPQFAVAPMMDWTDRHCRYFMRLLSPSVRLFTEMVTAQAIRHGDCERLLAFHDSEHPVALQVGGNDPEMMAEAAVAGARQGYDEININVGCPSDRVQSGRFGRRREMHSGNENGGGCSSDGKDPDWHRRTR